MAILVMHGECDSIVPSPLARKLFEQISSKDKELKIFTPEEGGAERCQVDAVRSATALIGDWFCEHL